MVALAASDPDDATDIYTLAVHMAINEIDERNKLQNGAVRPLYIRQPATCYMVFTVVRPPSRMLADGTTASGDLYVLAIAGQPGVAINLALMR